MTDYTHFEYPPPRSWELFEELCADLFQAMWNDPALVRYGRAGQRQHGVDIVARHGSLYPVGLQCKKKTAWPEKKLKLKEIEAEIEDAKKFRPTLRAFYLLTTAQSDTKITQAIAKINEAHSKGGLFPVAVLTWPEIMRRVTMEPAVAHKHFGAVGGVAPAPLLATLFTEKGKLQCPTEEFKLLVAELTLDLHDWPNGRVLVRQRESDALLASIKTTEKLNLTSLQREDRIKRRKEYRSLHRQELRVASGIHFLASTPDIFELIFEVWERGSADFLRGFIEYTLGDIGVPPSTFEVRVWPPDDDSYDNRITVNVPNDRIEDIEQRKVDIARRFGKVIAMNSVSELPESMRSKDVLPAILWRIIGTIEKGESADNLKRKRWFDLGSWRIQSYS